MKIGKFLFLIVVLLFSHHAWSHDAHYEVSASHQWTLIDGKQITGSFYLSKDETVMIETNDGKVVSIPLSRLSKSDQQLVGEKLAWIKKINAMQNISKFGKNEATGNISNTQWKNPIVKPQPAASNQSHLILLGLFAFLAFALKKIPALRPLKFAFPIVISAILLTLTSFTVSKAKRWMGSTRVSFMDSAFSYYKPAVSTRNDSKYYYVESLGLPRSEEHTS